MAVTKLLHRERELDAGDGGREVVLQQGEADRVADWAGHGDEGVLEWREPPGFVVGEASGRAAHAEARRCGFKISLVQHDDVGERKHVHLPIPTFDVLDRQQIRDQEIQGC